MWRSYSCQRVAPGPIGGNPSFREAVCIHTKKVYDSCKSKECIRDLRVYLTAESQAFINNNCVAVKPRSAELLFVNIDVEKVPYNRGFFTIDVRFFYRITVEANMTIGCPRLLSGLAVFDKRCILFGSEGGARIFSSKFRQDAPDQQMMQSANKPTAVVEAVEPILLEAKIVEPTYHCGCGCELSAVPAPICGCFGGEDISLNCDGNRLFVTLGQFSILRLERDIQLLMPAFDICMPERECSCTGANEEAEDPCDVFERFEFPIDEFFPPRREVRRESCRRDRDCCRDRDRDDSCGCNNGDNGGRCKCK